jgi:hypothetical protein
MTKTLRTQAAGLALAALATVGTVTGVDALAGRQYRAAQALVASRAAPLQVAAGQTVVIVARRLSDV